MSERYFWLSSQRRSMPKCLICFSWRSTKVLCFCSFCSSVSSFSSAFTLKTLLLKPSLLSVSTFQGIFFSFLRSSSILLSQFLSSWRSCCASACSLSLSPRTPPDPPPGSATSNSFSFFWHSASFLLHSLQPLSSSSFSFWNCSILSTRAWCRHRKREAVSMLGCVSSSSSDTSMWSQTL